MSSETTTRSAQNRKRSEQEPAAQEQGQQVPVEEKNNAKNHHLLEQERTWLHQRFSAGLSRTRTVLTAIGINETVVDDTWATLPSPREVLAKLPDVAGTIFRA